MTNNSRSNRLWRCHWPVLGLVAFAPSCAPPSLLITPVSGRRQLEETVLRRDSFLARSKIALIDVSGIIRNATAPGFLEEGENPVSLLLEQLDRAREDANVKAVILRINSPGGSVVASELMHNEISHFRESTGKPVVAVMMDVAASGGYYIACACDEIVAQPSSVTGSIGVIMLTVDASGTMNLIGVKTDAITSGVFKDAGSPFRAMRPEERELFQRMVNDMYERFVNVVAQGRSGLDEVSVRKVADGRVFLAEDALRLGLIDRVAPMRETVDAVKERIGAGPIKLVAYKRPADYRPNFYARRAPIALDRSSTLNFQLDLSPLPRAPEFLYLWVPGY